MAQATVCDYGPCEMWDTDPGSDWVRVFFGEDDETSFQNGPWDFCSLPHARLWRKQYERAVA